MLGLCIAESYYIEGLYRIEYFPTINHLNQYLRQQVSQRATTWILGEAVPKHKQITEWF